MIIFSVTHNKYHLDNPVYCLLCKKEIHTVYEVRNMEESILIACDYCKGSARFQSFPQVFYEIYLFSGSGLGWLYQTKIYCEDYKIVWRGNDLMEVSAHGKILFDLPAKELFLPLNILIKRIKKLMVFS